MIQIIPAILANSEDEFKRDIYRCMHSATFKEGWVHIDFADNIFVPNLTIGPSIVAKYTTELYKEAHIMVEKPMNWVDELYKAGFERIIFHLETGGAGECIEYIKSKGIEAGVAIKNDTPTEELEPLMAGLDVVLIMGIVPGFQGQKFIPSTFERIKELVKLRAEGDHTFRIGVDGSVNDSNIKEIVDAGADFVTVGSYLMKGNIDENLENLWEILK